MSLRRSTERTQAAQIYRDAAKLVEDGMADETCNAVQRRVLGREWYHDKTEVHAYAKTFAPDPEVMERLMSGYCFQFGVQLRSALDGDEFHGWRVLALCFAAAMAETGDL